MWKEVAAACVLALLVSSQPSSGQSGCHNDAPDSCQFTCGDTCGWTNETGWLSRNSSGWFLALTDQQQRGRLTSRKGCSAGGVDHCLTFWYRFTENFIVDLKVRVGENPNSAVEVWKNNFTPNRQWTRATVPFNGTTDFVVVIEADRYRPEFKTQSVFVDAVEYFSSSCENVPPVTTPPTDPEDDIPCVTPTMTTTTTTLPSTGAANDTVDTVSDSTGTSGQSTVKSEGSPKSTPGSGMGGESIASSTEASVDNGDDGGSSTNGGVIAGAVIAVIVVIVVAVAVVIFVFRKQLWSKEET